MRLLHIAAGSLGLISGAVALFARKGAALHRKSGLIFVYAMLVLSASGALMALVEPKVIAINVIAGVLTFYMVLTALLTVRRPAQTTQGLDVGTLLVALAVALAGFSLGFRGSDGPAVMYFVFGAVALLAAVGDLRMMRARGVQGGRRLGRHLWRMCFGLFVAAGSFFLGPPQRLPQPWRGAAWLPFPVLLVILMMFYWLARVSLRQRMAQLTLSTRTRLS